MHHYDRRQQFGFNCLPDCIPTQPRSSSNPDGHLILLLVIMRTLNNCLGYQALEDFSRRHHAALVERLKLPLMRFPSDSTLRRVMMGIDFAQLAQVFTDWVRDWMPSQENDWLGLDGKSIKATVSK